MTNIINFITHNAEKLIFIIIVGVILTALLGAFYFFVYSYVVNKRIKQPEKKHRIKLIMPRFACVILAVISVFIASHLSNRPFLIGPISYGPLTWQTEYDFVNTSELVLVDFSKEELNKNSDFTLYERTTDYFKYSMYFNKDFNGIIRQDSKNCEFVCFVDYIGKDKNLEKNDTVLGEVSLLIQNEQLGTGMGYPKKISKMPLCFYGSTDKTEIIDITMSVYKADKYKELDRLESTIEENDEVNEIDEKDFMYLEEHFTFDTNAPKLFKEYTHLFSTE
ncbi:MAG: hypothetical protein IJ725_04845 [Ruminococcus sp.]|nr:hypothetical protein [Ruminococcus sp.]